MWRRGRRAGDVSTSAGYLWRLTSQLNGPCDLLELLTGLGGGLLLLPPKHRALTLVARRMAAVTGGALGRHTRRLLVYTVTRNTMNAFKTKGETYLRRTLLKLRCVRAH